MIMLQQNESPRHKQRNIQGAIIHYSHTAQLIATRANVNLTDVKTL